RPARRAARPRRWTAPPGPAIAARRERRSLLLLRRVPRPGHGPCGPYGRGSYPAVPRERVPPPPTTRSPPGGRPPPAPAPRPRTRTTPPPAHTAVRRLRRLP